MRLDLPKISSNFRLFGASLILSIGTLVHGEVVAPAPSCGYHLVSLAAQHEQYRLFAYLPTPRDRPTVGFGATFHLDGRPVKLGEQMPLGEASAILHGRLKAVSDSVWALSGRSISNSQLAALTLFADNVGLGAYQRSTLRKYVVEGKYELAAAEFPKWSTQGGVQLKGLLKRRMDEQDLFLRPAVQCK